MNKGMLTVGIIILALASLLLFNIISNYTTGGELDYHLVKEITEASMEDALDMSFYSMSRVYRIDKDKFVESFLRRFAEGVDNTREYDISFYDIHEIPPKVTIKVDSLTVLKYSKDEKGQEIHTDLSAIIESNNPTDTWATRELNDSDSDYGKSLKNRKDIKEPTNGNSVSGK